MAEKKAEVTRREFLKTGLEVLAGAALSRALDIEEASAAGRPNLVYIIADQLRSVSVGAYGNDEISTPNIDRLASEGALFANAVSTSPVCGPHRACLMTGRYPTVTGVVENNIKLPREEIGFAEIYRQNGYPTPYIGKWHLNGPTDDMNNDPGWVPPSERQGFREWVAFNVAHKYYQSHYYLNNDPTIRTTPEGVYEPDFQTEKAIWFLEKYQSRPFCLFVSLGPPHQGTAWPYLPPGGDYVYPYDPETLTLRPNVDYEDLDFVRQLYAEYYGMTSNVDWNVGRILDALDSLGLSERTIVVFSSDHGDLLGSHYGRHGSVRQKTFIERESLNVPFILRYPRFVQPQVVEDVFTSVDIMPTLLGLSKLPIPDGVMGRDFSPLLVFGSPPSDPPWGPVPSTEAALIGMFNGWWIGVNTPQYSLEVDREQMTPNKLFDNLNDPYQMTNVVNDPAYQAVVDELFAVLLDWLDYIGYPTPARDAAPARGRGSTSRRS